jgi:hypothetical protein
MKTSKHTAIAKCIHCGEILISSSGGDFEQCTCGKSFIDQERFSGMYARTGNCEVIEVICPENCQYREQGIGNHSEHAENMKIDTTEELDKYMKKYKVEWKDGRFVRSSN